MYILWLYRTLEHVCMYVMYGHAVKINSSVMDIANFVFLFPHLTLSKGIKLDARNVISDLAFDDLSNDVKVDSEVVKRMIGVYKETFKYLLAL